jgi:inosine-uridine nucleoside N-ribohydrolase
MLLLVTSQTATSQIQQPQPKEIIDTVKNVWPLQATNLLTSPSTNIAIIANKSRMLPPALKKR